MENFDILQDIAERTGGDIYLGVVGPVRTGKSTFIKRFMELLVLPNITEPYERERAQDELPQSGGGRTIMTTEPKFVPAEAVQINILDGLEARIRLVDCVGYAVNGALGFMDEDGPRMVHTPWFEDAIAFEEAAELGTRKVIADHSTVGLIVTTDGSITDLGRDAYLEAEERVITEMMESGKPFVIIVNSTRPYDTATQELAQSLSRSYNVAALPLNVASMDSDDILHILKECLYEFPVSEVNVSLPRWIEELDEKYWLRSQLESAVRNAVSQVARVRDIDNLTELLYVPDLTSDVHLDKMELGSGLATLSVGVKDELFNQVLSDLAGREIEGEHSLIRLVCDFGEGYREWSKVASAVADARELGYGVVSPHLDEMYMEEPELIKQGGRFGVRLRANAPSLHIIRANIGTEITPLVGTERQCEELVRYILTEFEDDPQKLWQTNIFGKSLNELVSEGIQGKLYRMPENAQQKLQETLQRVINEGGGGLICIIL